MTADIPEPIGGRTIKFGDLAQYSLVATALHRVEPDSASGMSLGRRLAE